VVDGVRIDMRPGDVLLTPGWSWHGHGNDGDRPGYWIDFLDVPTVHLLEPMRLEHWPGDFQEPSSATRDHPFVFTWKDTEAELDAAIPDPSGRLGTSVDLASESAIPSLTLRMQRLESGFHSQRYRSTANQIISAKSGRGTAWVGDKEFDWQTGDVFVVPGWHAYTLAVQDRCELFTVSDEAMQKKLGYYHAEDL
jgi:gentisate 1,2-dioxygenase